MSGKQQDGNTGGGVLLGSTAIKPKERKGIQKFTYMLYDPKAGTILTRTPKSWLLITIFYVIYYTCLAGFWYGLLQIFLMNINLDEPRWTLSSSLIGINPGVGVRPQHHEEDIDTSIFALDLNYDGVAPGTVKSTGSIGYATRLQDFLNDYTTNKNPGAVDCSEVDDGQYNKNTDSFCKFDLANLGPCGQFPYGFAAANGKVSPCIILKLNRIWGLEPQPILADEDWPEDAPQDLKDKIMAKNDGKRVYVDCRGEYPADQEALSGKVSYYPDNQGIPLKYFPFVNKNHTQNALVAVQFKNLPVGQLVHIECRAYYKGVVYSRKEKEGMVRFEFLVEDN